MNKGMRKSNAFDIPYTAQQSLPMQLGPAGSLTYMLTRRGSPQSPIDAFILCWNCSCSGASMCHLSCNCFMVEVALLNSRGIGMGILYGFQESPKNCKTHPVCLYPCGTSWGKFCTSHCIPGWSKVILQVKRWNEKGLMWCDVMRWLMDTDGICEIQFYSHIIHFGWSKLLLDNNSHDLPGSAHEYHQRHHLLWNMFPSFSFG